MLLVEAVSAITAALLIPMHHLRGVTPVSFNPQYLFSLTLNNREVFLSSGTL